MDYSKNLKVCGLNFPGPVLEIVDKLQMGLRDILSHLHFLDASRAVSTLRQKENAMHMGDAVILSLYYRYVCCYFTEQLVTCHVRHHRSELHHEYSNCKVWVIKWGLTRQQLSSNLCSVFTMQYSYKEILMPYPIRYCN